MSLINDALRRAKDAQQQTPLPQPDLPFRPVEPAQQRARRGLGLLVPVMLALVACLALLLWQWVRVSNAGASIEVAARTAPAPAAAPVTAVTAMPITPAQADPPAPLASLPAPVAAAAETVAADAPNDAADAMGAGVSEDASTNAAPVVEPAPSQPAPLRLQGIVYHPKRPSAMINGKIVFIGDKIRDFRVLAIDKDTATLAGGGQTNVLSLPE